MGACVAPREDADLAFRLADACGPVGRCEAAIVVHPVRAERWGVSLRQQRNVYYDALLYRKHPRRYRERIRRVPPWDHDAVVVLVGVASAHRGDAFAACEFIMDYLKTRAPIWKKETAATASHWVESRDSDTESAARWSA